LDESKYDDSVSITEYREFDGRPHFPAAPGWEEVADFAIDWAERHAGLTVKDHAAAGDLADEDDAGGSTGCTPSR
jgi:hypothetical protein